MSKHNVTYVSVIRLEELLGRVLVLDGLEGQVPRGGVHVQGAGHGAVQVGQSHEHVAVARPDMDTVHSETRVDREEDLFVAVHLVAVKSAVDIVDAHRKMNTSRENYSEVI